MKAGILVLIVLSILIGGVLIAGQETSQELWPEYYGFYIRAGNELVSLPKNVVRYVFPNQDGFERECVSGLPELPGYDAKSSDLRFIIFLPEGDKYLNGVRLSKLNFKKQLPLSFAKQRRGEFDIKYIMDVGMWVGEIDIPLQIGPVQNRPGMFQIVPTIALAPGVYGVHWGAIFRTVLNGPNPSFDQTTMYAFGFSVNIDNTKVTAVAMGSERATSSYDNMEPTEENMRGLLSITHDFLKTRKRVTAPPEYNENDEPWINEQLVNLNNAYLALVAALRISEAIPLPEMTILITSWKTDLEAASKLFENRKLFWNMKSFDKERKVRLAIDKYLNPKKKK